MFLTRPPGIRILIILFPPQLKKICYVVFVVKPALNLNIQQLQLLDAPKLFNSFHANCLLKKLLLKDWQYSEKKASVFNVYYQGLMLLRENIRKANVSMILFVSIPCIKGIPVRNMFLFVMNINI